MKDKYLVEGGVIFDYQGKYYFYRRGEIFMKKKSTILLLITTFVFSFTFAMNVFATENSIAVNREKSTSIDGEQTIDMYENWENPATGEYFRWSNIDSRSIDKKFSFKIQWSVTSAKFKVNGTSVKINCDAYICNRSEKPVSGYSGHNYSVSLKGIYSRTLNFKVNGTHTGTITGLQKGGSYTIKVNNTDSLPDDLYLMGSGTVNSYN